MDTAKIATNSKDEFSTCSRPTAVVSSIGCVPGPARDRHEACLWVSGRPRVANLGLSGDSGP
jgi:hypothetical protein